MIVSHDVVSLFTNIPVLETIAVIKRQLEEDTGLKKPVADPGGATGGHGPPQTVDKIFFTHSVNQL